MLVYNNLFRLQTLTAAINNVKFAPSRIAGLGLFDERGITTVDASIEIQDGVLQLIDAKPRGAPGTPVFGKNRKIHSFRVPHLPETATVRADEVQGVRAFGSDNAAEAVQTRVNERLEIMRRNIDYTIEAHRLAAIGGSFYDANGAVTSLFTLFGLAQQSEAMGLNVDTTKLREKSLNVIEKVEGALDGVSYTGIHAFCGKDFWKALIEHKAVKETYLNAVQASELRGDPRLTFEFGGITWERYRGTSAVKIADAEALAFPLGTPNLFITRFAPADYTETVNTIGLPYYAKGDPMKFDKGWDLEAQSNPLNICTRPHAVIKLTVS